MTKTKKNLRFLTKTAAMAALLALFCPMAIPVGPVPVTLGVFAVFLIASISTVSVSVSAVTVYLVLGAVGLPVFSGFEGGIQKLVGVTGGFLVSYLFAAAVIPLIIRRAGGRKWAFFVSMLLALAGIYLCGAVWFAISYPSSLGQAFATAVVPFLLPDALKIVAASALGYLLRKRFPLLTAGQGIDSGGAGAGRKN